MAYPGSWLFQPLRYELDQSPYPRFTPNVPILAASAKTAPPSCQLMLSQSIKTATRSASATSPPNDSCPAISPHPWSPGGAFPPDPLTPAELFRRKFLLRLGPDR